MKNEHPTIINKINDFFLWFIKVIINKINSFFRDLLKYVYNNHFV